MVDPINALRGMKGLREDLLTRIDLTGIPGEGERTGEPGRPPGSHEHLTRVGATFMAHLIVERGMSRNAAADYVADDLKLGCATKTVLNFYRHNAVALEHEIREYSLAERLGLVSHVAPMPSGLIRPAGLWGPQIRERTSEFVPAKKRRKRRPN